MKGVDAERTARMACGGCGGCHRRAVSSGTDTPSCFYHRPHFSVVRRINPICVSWQPRARPLETTAELHTD